MISLGARFWILFIAVSAWATAASAFPIKVQLASGDLVLDLPLSQLPACNASPTTLHLQLAKSSLVSLDPLMRDALVHFNGSTYSVAQSFIRQGLAYAPGKLDQHVEDAAAERRGFWRCAPITSLFQAAGTSADERVLAAIALKESEFHPGIPWPWTINWRGKSLRFNTRDAAIQQAKNIIASGDELFDIGLMQVNWFYHKKRFNSLESAFSPLLNIRAADSILIEEYRRVNDWVQAVARYHSPSNSQRGLVYANGVIQKLATVHRENNVHRSYR